MASAGRGEGVADVDVVVKWVGEGLVFDASSKDGTIRMDGDGKAGPTPVQGLLLAVGVCTAADVVDILGKMRVPLEGLEFRADADRAPSPPRRYTAIRMTYVATGIGAGDRDKLQRAVDLSHEKYCSVLLSLRQDIEISTRIVVN
jgi:putative redox protein